MRKPNKKPTAARPLSTAARGGTTLATHHVGWKGRAEKNEGPGRSLRAFWPNLPTGHDEIVGRMSPI